MYFYFFQTSSNSKVALSVAINSLTQENAVLTNENEALKQHIEELEALLGNLVVVDDDDQQSPPPTPPPPAPLQDPEVLAITWKKQYKCSLCHRMGHNLRTCPEKHLYCIYLKKKDKK